jgi:hypothetical protein
VEGLNALSALFKKFLGPAPITSLCDGSVIFGFAEFPT